jgi:hypothetical protein
MVAIHIDPYLAGVAVAALERTSNTGALSTLVSHAGACVKVLLQTTAAMP